LQWLTSDVLGNGNHGVGAMMFWADGEKQNDVVGNSM